MLIKTSWFIISSLVGQTSFYLMVLNDLMEHLKQQGASKYKKSDKDGF